MRLTNQDKDKAMKHIEDMTCAFCSTKTFKVAPVSIDMLQQGSSLVPNDYILFSMIAFQCETCKKIQFFNRNILKDETDEPPATA